MKSNHFKCNQIENLFLSNNHQIRMLFVLIKLEKKENMLKKLRNYCWRIKKEFIEEKLMIDSNSILVNVSKYLRIY